MDENLNKTQFVVLRVIGVLVGVILIAGIGFAAYRFGQQRGVLALSEAAVTSSEIEGASWANAMLYWHPFSFLVNLVMVIVAIFLLRLAVGMILAPRCVFRRHPYCPRHFRYWDRSYACGFWQKEGEDSSRREDASES